MTADQALLDALAALERALAESGAPHMLIGGLAVIARGVPRQTTDVDATVLGESLDLETLIARLAEQGILPRIPDALGFARDRQVLLLRHDASGTPIEVTIGWLPFEAEAISRAERIDFAGVMIPAARAEDLVVYKLVAWRDRDRADVERLLVLHGGRIDLSRVRRIVREFAEALEEPQRVEAFEALLRRIGFG